MTANILIYKWIVDKWANVVVQHDKFYHLVRHFRCFFFLIKKSVSFRIWAWCAQSGGYNMERCKQEKVQKGGYF